MNATATRTRPGTETETTCPTCGAKADGGQLICLECGSRIALGYRRPPSWRVPIAIVAFLVLATIGGIYAGVQAIQDDADQELAAESTSGAPPTEANESEPRTGGTEAKQPAEEKPAAEKKANREKRTEAAKPEAPVGAGGVRSWRAGEDAFTVVILSAEDRPSAREFARSASQSGTKAGVLEADDFPSLSASTGFWIVFVGTYPNRAKADAAAARLGRNYAGAYPQFVNGSKARG